MWKISRLNIFQTRALSLCDILQLFCGYFLERTLIFISSAFSGTATLLQFCVGFHLYKSWMMWDLPWGTPARKGRLLDSEILWNTVKGLVLKFISFHTKVLHLEHGVIWCWNLDTTEGRSEISGKFLNMMLEKDGEDQLDRSCEKCRSTTKN
jgi:hypothetical protein